MADLSLSAGAWWLSSVNLARHLPGQTRDAVTAAVRNCDEPKLFVATAQLLRRIVDLARNGSSSALRESCVQLTQ